MSSLFANLPPVRDFRPPSASFNDRSGVFASAPKQDTLSDFLEQQLRLLFQYWASPHISKPQFGLRPWNLENRDFLFPLFQKIEDIAGLESGWDGTDAPEIDPQAIEHCRRALNLLSWLDSNFVSPEIVPTFSRGVQIEWHTPERSLEFEYCSNGWSILGVMLGRDPATRSYFNAEVAADPVKLVPFYRWFVNRELVWPSP